LFEKICDETKSAVEQSEQKKLERWWKMVWHNTFPLQRRKQSDRKVCCVLQQGQKEWKCSAVQTVWGCPSYKRMLLGLPHSTIILGHQYWWD
jgi:hypothetical protein